MDRVGVPFVGRNDELALLDRWRDEAWDGHLRIALVRGPAGIGKTLLAAEVAAAASVAGGTVLAGTCQEHVAVPYLPLASALQGLPAGVAAVAPLLNRADPDGATLAAFVGIASAIIDAATSGPVLLSIDDVHWADPATVDLLEHVLAACASAAVQHPLKLLVVLLSRPEAGDRAARLLGRVTREPAARPLELRGLDEPSVNELITRASGTVPPRQRLRDVVDATAGNPLLVLSWARTPSGEPAPTDLDTALAARLVALDADALALVNVCALAGPGELAVATALPPDRFERALDAAAESGVLTGAGEFEHPQLRRVVLQRLTSADVQALSASIADRLEAFWAEDAGAHALELAHHLSRAGDLVAAARRRRWCHEAGDQALAIAAWADAGRLLDEAARLAEADGAADPALLARAALAHFRNHDIPMAVDRATRAAAAAEAIGDVDTWGDAVLTIVRARLSHGPEVVGRGIDTTPLRGWLDAAGPQARRRAEALELMAEAEFGSLSFDAGTRFAREAMDLAAASGEDGVVAQAAFSLGLQDLGQLRIGSALEAFAMATEAAARAVDPWFRPWGPTRSALALAMTGELESAAERVRAGREAAANHDFAELSLVEAVDALLALARGSLRDAERSSTRAGQLFLRSDYAYTPQIASPALAVARAAGGDIRGAHTAIDAASSAGSRGLRWWHPVLDAIGGDAVSAEAGLDARPWGPPPGFITMFAIGRIAGALELAGALDRHELAAAYADALDQAMNAGVVFSPDGALFLPRLAVVAHRLAGRLDEASAAGAAALAIAEKAGSRLEAARTHFELALVAAAAKAPAEVVRRWATPAATTLDQLGALALVSRARSLAGDVPLSDRVVLMTDLVSSTEQLLSVGELRWSELIGAHDAAMRSLFSEEGGVEIRQTGDGMCAWFASGDAAVSCAVRVTAVLEEVSRRHAGPSLVSRVGVASGPLLIDNGVAVGAAIHLAARVCAVGNAGEVIVTAEVARHLGSTSVRVVPAGSVALKGFPDAVAIARVEA